MYKVYRNSIKMRYSLNCTAEKSRGYRGAKYIVHNELLNTFFFQNHRMDPLLLNERVCNILLELSYITNARGKADLVETMLNSLEIQPRDSDYKAASIVHKKLKSM